MFWVLGSVLDYGKCFAVWEVLDSGKCVVWKVFGFWEVFCCVGSVLDSGKCFGFWEVFCCVGSVFGFWEVFLDSGKCFWILGSVFGFWEVFWILGSVLDSGKCFGFWKVFCPYGPPYKPVRDKWVYPKKMERHFPIKPRQPIGIALATSDDFRIT